MRKSLSAALAAFLIVALSACGSASESGGQAAKTRTEPAAVAPTPTEPASTKTEAADLAETAEITEQGFGQSGGYAWVTAMVHNVGSVGEFATVHFNLYDEAGTLIASGDQVESLVSEDGWTAIGTQVEVPGGQQAASVEATLAISDYGMAGEPLPAIGPVDASMGDPQITFVVKNETSENWENLRVGIICRDEAGSVAGGGSAYPALIPAGSESMVDGYVVISDAATSCTAYPNHGGF